MFRRIISLVALAAALVIGQEVSRADTVLMHNGTMHYGEIVEVTDAEVVIKTKVSKIVTTLHLKRAEVAEIDRPGFQVKEGFFEKKDSGADRATPRALPSEFLVIPIKGGIGEVATAKGMEAALKGARERSVRHIVFDIDTPGGRVSEAKAMAEVIEAFRAATEKDSPVAVHAYVRNAISAGIWVLFSCDDVYWAEGGSAGGAVVFTIDRSTGSAEVDAKQNSIIAAKMASMAEQHGHPKHVVRAMMQPEASLYAWRTGDGRSMISDTAPKSGAEVVGLRQLDGPGGVLTLTASDAIEIGFGRLVAAGPSGIGATLGVAGWASAGEDGAQAMEQAAKSAKRQADQEANQDKAAAEVYAEFQSRFKAFIKQAEAADQAHPLRKNTKYEVDGNGNFTPASRAAWAANCNVAIKVFEELLDTMNDLKRLDARFQRLAGESLISKSGKKIFVEEVRDTIKWIQDRKNATRP